MTNEEIKVDCDTQYKAIKKAEERLAEIRVICPHDNTFLGSYSYRVGSIFPALICENCGALIKIVTT